MDALTMDRADIERLLLSRPLPPLLPQHEGWILPAYDGLSICSLPTTIAALFGIDLPGALPPLPEWLWTGWKSGVRRVVLVVLDGLGYGLLRQRLEAGEGQAFAQLAAAGCLIPLTSVFPSTTDAALVSISTGCPPATHGWLAWEMYLRELGVAANAVLLTPIWSQRRDLLIEWGLELDSLIPVPTLAQRLSAAGVSTLGLLSSFFERSAFTHLVHRGIQRVQGHHHASDFWTLLRHMLSETRGQRAFITAYWGGLDTLGHAYGPHTDLWAAEYRSLTHLLLTEFLERLPAQDRDGTLLLITADHGQIDVPLSHILTADGDPVLRRELLIPIMGESRAAFVYPRPGRAEAIRAHLEEGFPSWFHVVDSAQALESGMMGAPVSDETYARTGELLVLPRSDHALQRAKPSAPLRGRHGGLTYSEMLVPLIAVRLDAVSA